MEKFENIQQMLKKFPWTRGKQFLEQLKVFYSKSKKLKFPENFKKIFAQVFPLDTQKSFWGNTGQHVKFLCSEPE